MPIGIVKLVDELKVNLEFVIFILYKLYLNLSILNFITPIKSIYF